MSRFTKLFSGGVTELVMGIGDTIDKLVTSDEERMKLKNELSQQVSDFKKSQMQHVENMEKEVSDRHKADMASDSWLSKNVRPLMLIFTISTTMVFAWATTFADLTELQINTLNGWLPLLQNVLLGFVSFYVGGRSFEKFNHIRHNPKHKENK